MNYGFRGFKFELPDTMEDESVLTFVTRTEGAIDMNITFTRDTLPSTLDAYLGDAVDQMKKSLSGYKLVERAARKIAGREAAVLTHSATSPEGQIMHLIQGYVPDGKELLIITGTTVERKDEMLSAFDKIAGSLKA